MSHQLIKIRYPHQLTTDHIGHIFVGFHGTFFWNWSGTNSLNLTLLSKFSLRRDEKTNFIKVKGFLVKVDE